MQTYRGNNRSSYRGTKRGRNIGLERALKHIEEGKALSRELGGTDEDVKRYFFNLPQAQLNSILQQYGDENGESAEEYARKTLPAWRSGRRQMSGLVASRLFSQLPRSMPLSDRYDLITSLWQKHRPRSSKRVRVGTEAAEQEVLSAVEHHLKSVVAAYTVSENLSRRFTWLAAGDVNIHQQLLNHFLEEDRCLVVEALRQSLPVFFNQIRCNRNVTSLLRQRVSVGGHELELLFDPTQAGIRFENISSGNGSSKGTDGLSPVGCLISAGVLLFFLIIYILGKH